MKKTRTALLSLAIIAAMLTATACGSGTNAETTAKTTEATTTTTSTEATTEAATETTTEAPAETTAEAATEATEATTEAAETTSPEAEKGEGIALDVTMLDGKTETLTFYKNEWDGYEAIVPKAYLRPLLPNCYTSVEHPDSFNLPEYAMTDTAEKFDGVEFPETFAVKQGDSVGSLKVLDAYIQYLGTDYSGTIEAMPFSSEVHFDGTLTLSGDFVYITEDEYGAIAGNVYFYPNPTETAAESFATMASFFGNSAMSMTAWEKVAFGAYGDVCSIFLGNMLQGEGVFDYSNKADILAAFDGSKNILSGTATISNITLTNSDQFGIRCSAVADSVSIN